MPRNLLFYIMIAFHLVYFNLAVAAAIQPLHKFMPIENPDGLLCCRLPGEIVVCRKL